MHWALQVTFFSKIPQFIPESGSKIDLIQSFTVHLQALRGTGEAAHMRANFKRAKKKKNNSDLN